MKQTLKTVFSVIISFAIVFGCIGLNTTKADALASYTKKTSYLQVSNPTRHTAQIRISGGGADSGWRTVSAGRALGLDINNVNTSVNLKIEFRNSGNPLSPVYTATPGYITVQRGKNHYVTPKTKLCIDLFNKYVASVG